jgi:hypothetical protein
MIKYCDEEAFNTYIISFILFWFLFLNILMKLKFSCRCDLVITIFFSTGNSS